MKPAAIPSPDPVLNEVEVVARAMNEHQTFSFFDGSMGSETHMQHACRCGFRSTVAKETNDHAAAAVIAALEAHRDEFGPSEWGVQGEGLTIDPSSALLFSGEERARAWMEPGDTLVRRRPAGDWRPA